MNDIQKIDLHMHTTVSDGTDTPEKIAALVQKAGIGFFAITDHDAVKGGKMIRDFLTEDSPRFLTGVEFSCRDEEGKYHILGYGFDPDAEAIQQVVETGHAYRMQKFQARLDFLKKEFGFVFSDEDLADLFEKDNPGKPHIGNLMVKYGYAKTKEEAIRQYINRVHFSNEFIRPEEAVKGILESGGIPVLAHPAYGSGDEIVVGEEMDRRLSRLIGYGLQGVEAFYSGFTKRIRDEMLSFARKYDLYITAGSDYHGANKLVRLGDTRLDEAKEYPPGLCRFMEAAFGETVL